MHSLYIVSARTENGPVTPRMVKGWLERLVCSSAVSSHRTMTVTHMENMSPHNPVLNITSIVPHVCPVKYIQMARKCNPRQDVRKEDIDRTGKDQLVEERPVRDISALDIIDVLPEETRWLSSPFGHNHLRTLRDMGLLSVGCGFR